MAKPLDYSVWDHIEISDDEDDTHPNVDTPSLFRWRHQARVERMEQAKKEKEDLENASKTNQRKLEQMKQKIKEAELKSATDELNKLKLEVSELEKQDREFKAKEDELNKKEKTTPWNIDTICHEGKTKTIINKDTVKKREDLTEDEKWKRQEEFIKKYESEVKKFGMFRRHEDSQNYLVDNQHLVCEETANYLVLWCINLEVEEKHDLMNHVAYQTIVLQFIMELAKQLDRDPRSCVRPFFSKIKFNDKNYQATFDDELNSFKDRVRERARIRIEDAVKEVEEEERQKRLGPGGLDPVEVFESLPEILKECFDKKDIPLLQKAIADLPRDEAEYHMKRCVASGLWVPDANKDSPEDDGQDDDDADEASDAKAETTADPASPDAPEGAADAVTPVALESSDAPDAVYEKLP